MGNLRIYTIFYSPADQPGRYVTRAFDGETPLAPAVVSDSLEEARAAIPPGCVLIAPDPEADHPSVVESWL